MTKNLETKFTQHLFLMGERFDDRVTQWFKGALIIEHDLSEMERGCKLAILMRICSVTMGHKITKLTEVIGGSQKGMTLARLSGAYPVAITQTTAYERGLVTRLVDMVEIVVDLTKLHSDYSDCLSELRSRMHGLKGASVAHIRDAQRAIQNQNRAISDMVGGLVQQNFRRLLV
jgi:hypothetical protein